MPKSIKETVRKVLKNHIRGLITTKEIADFVYGFAIRPVFFELLNEMPAPAVESLRRYSTNSESHPEDIDVITIHDYFGKFSEADPEVAQHNSRTFDYWSLLRLREHFQPGLPPPVFKPVRKIGTVDQSLDRNGSIILLGKIEWQFARQHPILLARPKDDTLAVTVEDWKTLIGKSDDKLSLWKHAVYDPEFFRDYMDTEYYTTHYKRYHYPVFSKKLQSPADAPPGTEVYVDRTAAAEIMPIEEIDRIVLGDYVD